MVKLIRTLTPENGMHFDEICSFQTMHYIGIWNQTEGKFAVFEKSGVEFDLVHLPACKNLDELDDRVFAEYEERIVSVSDSSAYEFALTED